VPTTRFAVVTEDVPRLGEPAAEAGGGVIYWYFNEVGNHTDLVGVADRDRTTSLAESRGIRALPPSAAAVGLLLPVGDSHQVGVVADLVEYQ